MTRVLFVGDLAPTGFGSVTSDLGRAMLDAGMDVRFMSQNEVGTLPEPFLSRTLDVAYFDTGPEGVNAIRRALGDAIDGEGALTLASGDPWGDWRPDAILLLGDFYAARHMVRAFREQFLSVPTFHYVPIEGTDLPPLWADTWSVVQPVAMSRFGQEQIATVTGTLPPLAYHGVDTDVFHPVSPEHPIVIETDGATHTLRSKGQCRAFFGMPPATKVILRTDRNMPRKRYGSLLRAMVPVLREHRDAALVLHARPLDQGGYLPDDISKMPRELQARVVFTQAVGCPREVLAAIYNTADVYVSTSAEGFGLTVAEAVACGVPAVGLDYSAVPEVIGDAGVVVPVATRYDNEYAHEWAWPQEDEFARSVSWFLSHPARARETGARGPRHVARTFRWDIAADVFAGLFQTAQGRGDSLPPEAGDFTFVPVEVTA